VDKHVDRLIEMSGIRRSSKKAGHEVGGKTRSADAVLTRRLDVLGDSLWTDIPKSLPADQQKSLN
jgi:hypothetical protein